MKVVVQRVSRAQVSVAGEVVSSVDGPGLVLLVGVRNGDTPDQAQALARKVATLRIMRDEEAVVDAAKGVLVVSQFTLYADTRKGRRPSWSAAAPGEMAEPLVALFAEALRAEGLRVGTGVFGADMAVDLVNDGPVTLLLEA